jgi:hypothetical protein
MNTTHTPGEWHTHDGQIYPLETGVTLALIPYWDEENEEHQANARLIAAAPDLLEALKEAIDQLETWNTESEDTFTMRRIKTAIQKATQP